MTNLGGGEAKGCSDVAAGENESRSLDRQHIEPYLIVCPPPAVVLKIREGNSSGFWYLEDASPLFSSRCQKWVQLLQLNLQHCNHLDDWEPSQTYFSPPVSHTLTSASSFSYLYGHLQSLQESLSSRCNCSSNIWLTTRQDCLLCGY